MSDPLGMLQLLDRLESLEKDQKHLREYVENWARVLVQLEREVRIQKGESDAS